MKALLVYEMIPDEVQYYVLEDLGDEDIAILDDANGKYINIDEDYELDSVSKVSDFIAPDESYCFEENKGKEGNCKWHKFKVEITKGECSIGSVDRVYVCGFYQ
jgi:hypothetical protein